MTDFILLTETTSNNTKSKTILRPNLVVLFEGCSGICKVANFFPLINQKVRVLLLLAFKSQRCSWELSWGAF